MFHTAFGVYITFQVMAVTGQSTGDHNAVGAVFESVQYLKRIQAAGAGNLYDFGLRRILNAQHASQICGSVCAMMATIGDDLEIFPVFGHLRLYPSLI